MIFNTPIGFLGLLALIVLILIYIIKQNFQQKIISSTFIWKLSLKYRKKRLPVSKFRNLLIFICQVLAFVACAFILAWPIIGGDITSERNEKILIIDGAANMLAVLEESGETRFEAAVAKAREYGLEAMDKTGLVTVILAGPEATLEIGRTDSVEDFNRILDDLVKPNQFRCSYGIADIAGAMTLSEAVLTQNSLTEVVLFTATTYASVGNVTLVSVSEEDWNVAIVDAKTGTFDNLYTFDINVASYNRDSFITVDVNIMDAIVLDADGNEDFYDMYTVTKSLFCPSGATELIEIRERVSEYSEVRISLVENDSFLYDNEMYLYSNKKETIRVLYTSNKLNPFVDGAILSVRAVLKQHWDIEIVTLEPQDEEDYILSGFDFYIFEGEMPGMLPTDGAILIIDPDKTAVGMGLVVGSEMQIDGQGMNLTGIDHAITKYTQPENVLITRFRSISAYDAFEPVMFCADTPLVFVKNELESRIAVIAFSVHYSDIAVLVDFPILLRNLFHYFLPVTVNGSLFSVGDTVEINSRGLDLEISGELPKTSFESFPLPFTFERDGTYTIVQTLLSGRTSSRSIFVRIPKSESDFSKVVLELPNPHVPPGVGEPLSIDLVIVLASILVALLFIEWWLQSREQA